MGGTVTGGTQSTNNIYGILTSGVNVEGYTDQTAVASQYLTATGLTATVIGRRAAYTIQGQRGSALGYDTSAKKVNDGMRWDYKNSGTNTICFDTWHEFKESGSFQTKLTLFTSLGGGTVTQQLAAPLVIGTPIVSKHDQSFVHRDDAALSEHEESFVGREY